MFPTKSILFASAFVAGLAVISAGPSWAQSPPADQKKKEELKKDEHHPPGPAKPGQAQGPQGQQPAVGQRPGQPSAPAAQVAPSPAPPTAQDQLKHQQQQPAAQAPSNQPPTAQQPGQKPPPTLGQKPGQPPAPAAQGSAPTPSTAQDQMKHQQPPAAQTQTPSNQAPTLGQKPGQPSTPAAQTQTPPNQAPTAQAVKPGAVPPPTTQVRQSNEFIRPQGQQAAPGIAALKQERHEVREGNKVFIQEQDRTIIQESGRTIIRHSEVDRFTVGARNVHNEQRGGQTISIVERADGSRIESVVDADGRLIRRTRRDPGGREIVIIDNTWVTPQQSVNFVVELPVPVISIPRERYIVDVDRVGEPEIYAALIAPPIERIARRYSLDEVRYSPMLRDRMPRVDLDTVTFDTGSWQIGPEQIDKLAVIAHALHRAVERNPREVFLIEGHTDAVGSDVDNLSLSDRRAETVAVVLTEQFQVPAENLSTQGYGSQYLKIPTPGPERQNRRVAVRRITPLLDPDQREGG
jgi:outer membrane protein OmpA-like peptidoglycan-associated protein